MSHHKMEIFSSFRSGFTMMTFQPHYKVNPENAKLWPLLICFIIRLNQLLGIE